MIETFVIYSMQGGWVTAQSTLVSDWRKAQTYNLDQAFVACRRHLSHTGEPEWFPVPVQFLEELKS